MKKYDVKIKNLLTYFYLSQSKSKQITWAGRVSWCHWSPNRDLLFMILSVGCNCLVTALLQSTNTIWNMKDCFFIPYLQYSYPAFAISYKLSSLLYCHTFYVWLNRIMLWNWNYLEPSKCSTPIRIVSTYRNKAFIHATYKK